jgi:hypothetical protein
MGKDKRKVTASAVEVVDNVSARRDGRPGGRAEITALTRDD